MTSLPPLASHIRHIEEQQQQLLLHHDAGEASQQQLHGFWHDASSSSSFGGGGARTAGASDAMTPDSDDDITGSEGGYPAARAVRDNVFELQEREKGRYDGGGGEDEDEYAYDEAVEGDVDLSGEGRVHRSRRRKRGRRGSASTAASFQLYTPDEEKAVVKKFDRKLVVFVAALYMLSFLDRSSRSSLLHGWVCWGVGRMLTRSRYRERQGRGHG